MCHSGSDGDMHRQVSWMQPADEAILRFLATSRTERGGYSWQTAKTIGLNTGYSNRHIGNRCRTLADRGLIDKHERAAYKLNEMGEAALDGGLDLADLE